ncbi:hypothetical protein D9619_002349 [Psilocybe cf. subviscida]|uniref:DUF6533 domain-containing protein n=1 Tax=Psilocybe cf. subviscida TaxID=2480587 RepID=A0A8H5AWL4_9AGAR|nr:hypothetical protein D9619_002349 [Psilocybe cf. subviscida]
MADAVKKAAAIGFAQKPINSGSLTPRVPYVDLAACVLFMWDYLLTFDLETPAIWVFIRIISLKMNVECFEWLLGFKPALRVAVTVLGRTLHSTLASRVTLHLRDQVSGEREILRTTELEMQSTKVNFQNPKSNLLSYQ